MYESSGTPAAFVGRMRHLMGLARLSGEPNLDQAGNPRLLDPAGQPRLRPTEVSLRGLCEAICGEGAVERYFHPQVGAVARASLMQESMYRPLAEAGEGAIGPSAFANINAFTGVVAGLLEVSVIEGFQAPEFIADRLFPAKQTRIFEGRKMRGISGAGDVAEERIPGMPTKRVQFGERYMTQPRTVENSLAVEVLQETIYLDDTGQVTEEANNLGQWLGYRRELRCINEFVGVTNTYNYNGSSYNSFLTSGVFVNDITANPITHYTAFKAAELKFRDMTDPNTGTRVLINPNAVLVNRGKLIETQALLSPLATVQVRDNVGAGQVISQGPNVIANRNYQIMESPLVYERMTASDGLNWSASDADGAFFLFELGKGHEYAQNWPLRVQQAAPGQLDMIDRGVVLYVKADERGIPWTTEPRRKVRSKPS